MKVINKNTKSSATAKPAASDMKYGEIAVNYHATDPKLLIKDSSDNIIGFPNETNVNGKFTTVNNTISGLTADVSENKTGIETLETWTANPLTDTEIASAFSD